MVVAVGPGSSQRNDTCSVMQIELSDKGKRFLKTVITAQIRDIIIIITYIVGIVMARKVQRRKRLLQDQVRKGFKEKAKKDG